MSPSSGRSEKIHDLKIEKTKRKKEKDNFDCETFKKKKCLVD